MALLGHKFEPVGSESLEKWVFVASGAFGQVYKARHKDWGFDVAIKLLRDGLGRCPYRTLMPNEQALSEEASHMDKASCEFVLRVYGMYQGNMPSGGPSMQQGIVMEFMGRGSVQTLLTDLSGRPPWPLAFRLAHQVALGMNFLHSKGLMHCDLKPSNVLLNDDLNAKIADFGLCRGSTSVLISNSETTEKEGGTYKYMPPEAFKESYKPAPDFDKYSYGILLWSIVTGKEPYPMADSSLVALRIPKGDRPPCEEITQGQVEGLKELVDLMQLCWDWNPSKRPTFTRCREVTEEVFLMHKRGIHSAKQEVLTHLESGASNQHSNTSAPSSVSPQTPDAVDAGSFRPAERSAAQPTDTVSTKTMSDTDRAKFVDDNRAAIIQNISEVMALVEELGNMVHSETYSVINSKQTSQEKMRELYQRTLRSGGVKVKAAFYTVLKRNHPMLVESLEGSS